MCISNILATSTERLANIMANFAEVLGLKQSKNINRISTEIGKQLNSFNENLSAYKANRSSGEATISLSPNKRSTGAAIIIVNPPRHTSRANDIGDEDRNSDSSQGETDMRNAKTKCVSSKRQKCKTHT